ncbi:hypothetical protein TRICI_006325 [Trichomonascus ciferrii]|uniref:Proline racemase n=1 Tax=Trichomonascus ciferrii TaxID=44093 RepID=A0A642UII9_9ASCO|nr:hypothetical protein TRICI_006325 [Trichomonascus ciferrii]
MPYKRSVSVVGCHAEGEVGDVIVGGVLDVPGKTMYEKMKHFLENKDELRNMLLNEPRGRSSMNTNLVLPPCDPRADAGFLIMESDEYAPMSGSNTICTSTVLLETGMIPMKEPVTKFSLDTAAGLVDVTAECKDGKCEYVQLDNVPAFVFKLDYPVEVPGLGTVRLDIAWGGMMYAFVDASSVGLTIENGNGRELIEYGERIKAAVRNVYTPVHPENPEIGPISNVVFTDPLYTCSRGKTAKNATVVSPGRFDRSPCGTGTSARLAVLHSRGELAVNEPFIHTSIIDTEFVSHISGTTKVGNYDAVIPTIKGRAWITSHKTVVLDSSDPYPEGFRVGDQWHVSK